MLPQTETRLAITPVTADDLSQVMALARSIWPTAYAGILTPEQIDNLLERIYNEENLRQEMNKGHRFWLAYHNGIAAGYASGYRENADIIWLKKIYIEPSLQGKGVGTALTQAVINAFRPARELRLLANPQNHSAHHYYLRQGFAKIGKVPVKMGDWNFIDHLFSKPLTDH